MSKADDLLNTPYDPSQGSGPSIEDWAKIRDAQKANDPYFGTNYGSEVMGPDGTPLFPTNPSAAGMSFSDRRDYGYGNFTPGAVSAQQGFNTMGDTAANRAAPTLQRTSGDWSGAGATAGQFSNPAYMNQMGTRGQQEQFTNQLRSDMAGNQPSLAQLQLKQGADMSLQNQAAMAASGGPTNYAFAQRNAAQQGANTMQGLSMQQGQLRAQEYAQARGELGNALNQQRVQDLQSTGMSYQNAIQQAQLEAGQNQNQANLEAQQRNLNQAGQMGFYGMGQHVADQDLASRMHYQDLMATKYANDKNLAQNAAQFQTAEDNRQTAAQYQMAAGALGGMSGGLK